MSALPMLFAPPASAVEVQFVVDDDVLVQAICRRRPFRDASPEQIQAMLDVQNAAWTLDQDAYYALRANGAPDLTRPGEAEEVDAVTRDFIAKVERTAEFAKVKAQAQRRSLGCQAEWRADAQRSEAFIRALTGIPPIQASYRVYVFHPAMPAGSNQGNHRIFWGGREDWPHYTTVYMWHEILHDYLPHDQLGHVLVQLATDRELRCYLDPTADREHYTGHEELEELTRTVLPTWRRYLIERHRDIRALYDELKNLHLPGSQ